MVGGRGCLPSRAVSISGDRIAEEAEYEGVRVRFQGSLGTARVSMQIDVGFGKDSPEGLDGARRLV
jgi:hypothetical protein